MGIRNYPNTMLHNASSPFSPEKFVPFPRYVYVEL